MPPGSVSDSAKVHGAVCSGKKCDNFEGSSEIKTEAKIGKICSLPGHGGAGLQRVVGQSLTSTTCQSNKKALDWTNERKLSSTDEARLSLAASCRSCQLKPDDIPVRNKTITESEGASGFTPNLSQSIQSATGNGTEENASQRQRNVASAANAIPESKALATTDIGVSLIFLNKNVPKDWFSLLDLLALTAEASSNLKRLRLLDVNVEIPSPSRLENYPFKVGIEHLIMAKTRFRNGSLVQLLSLAADVCPHLQLLGLSDWLEDIGPDLDVDYYSPLDNSNLTEMRVEFLHNSVSLEGILSLTSALCPNLRVLSIANAKASTSTPSTELAQSRKTRTRRFDGRPSRFRLSLIRCWNPLSIPELLSMIRWYHEVAILNVALWNCQLAIPPEQSDHSWFSDRHEYQVHLTNCRARLVRMSVQGTMSKTCPFLELVANGDEDDPSLKYQTHRLNSSNEHSFFDDRRRLVHYALLQREIDMIESPRSPRDGY